MAESANMNTKTIVILFAVTIVVLMLAVDESNAQRTCVRCTGPPRRCRACQRACEPTCRNPRPRCPPRCGNQFCRCRPPLIRAPNGRCVRPNRCPRPSG